MYQGRRVFWIDTDISFGNVASPKEYGEHNQGVCWVVVVKMEMIRIRRGFSRGMGKSVCCVYSIQTIGINHVLVFGGI